MVDNGGPTHFNNGDILSAISGDITLIKNNTKDIKDNTSVLFSIDDNIDKILNESRKWSQTNAHSRIYDTSANSNRRGSDLYEERKSRNNNRRNNDQSSERRNDSSSSRNDRNDRNDKNSRKSKSDGFIDSFFKQLERDMLGSNFKGAVQKSMKDFATALGVEVKDIPSVFGKTLAKQFSNTNLSKALSDRIQSTLGNS